MPSGTLWATCNLGATNPEEYGDYYMWGSVTPNTNDVCNWANAPFNGGASTFNKTYFNAHKSEWLDGDVLKPEYDAAYQATGGKALMPTREDFEELLANTTNEGATENGVDGAKFISKIDPTKSIFIPSAGFHVESLTQGQEDYFNLFSSSYIPDDPGMAWGLYCMPDAFTDTTAAGFESGLSIRPVRKP